MLVPAPAKTHKVIAGLAWSYKLGAIQDFEGDNVRVGVELRNAIDVINFSEETMTLWIDAGVTNQQT